MIVMRSYYPNACMLLKYNITSYIFAPQFCQQCKFWDENSWISCFFNICSCGSYILWDENWATYLGQRMEIKVLFVCETTTNCCFYFLNNVRILLCWPVRNMMIFLFLRRNDCCIWQSKILYFFLVRRFQLNLNAFYWNLLYAVLWKTDSVFSVQFTALKIRSLSAQIVCDIVHFLVPLSTDVSVEMDSGKSED